MAVLFLVIGALPQRATPAQRPNVVIFLADDLGFSDAGCYGGEIRTPSIDRMAGERVRFTQFYNMARCCPTRASLLTGLYPHQAGLGAMNQDLGRPAYQGELNDRCVTLAEVLRNAGYRTGMVGKWHLCHVNIARAPSRKQKAMLAFAGDEPISPSKQNWPCNRGFEEHWGTIPGVGSFHDPYGLVHNEATIRPDGKEFYYTDFITDHAVALIDRCAGDRQPFFLYVAYTAPHWPMQVREADAARHQNLYRAGWDAIRTERFERQVRMGLVKREWGLSPRAANPALNDGASQVGPWHVAPEKEWQARRMAVYAGMVECMDRGIGHIMDRLRARGVDRDTFTVFLSDNGGCQENVQPAWYDVPDRTRYGSRIHVGNDPRFSPGRRRSFRATAPPGRTPPTRRSTASSTSRKRAASPPRSSSAGWPAACSPAESSGRRSAPSWTSCRPSSTWRAPATRKPSPTGASSRWKGGACCPCSAPPVAAGGRRTAPRSAGSTRATGPSESANGSWWPRTASSGSCSTWCRTAPS